MKKLVLSFFLPFLFILSIILLSNIFKSNVYAQGPACFIYKAACSPIDPCGHRNFTIDCKLASLACQLWPGCNKYTGTECCVGGLGYDYCQGDQLDCSAGSYKGFHCCFNPTPTPTPSPCVQNGGSCIASYPCSLGYVSSSLSCGGSGVCCIVAPTSTPTPTPTPPPSCNKNSCSSCISDPSCAWGQLSGANPTCYGFTLACPVGFTHWYWAGLKNGVVQDCTTDQCVAPTPTFTPTPTPTPTPTLCPGCIPTPTPTLPPGATPTNTPPPGVTNTPTPIPTPTSAPPPPISYKMHGYVYTDVNGNQKYDGGDVLYTGSSVKVSLHLENCSGTQIMTLTSPNSNGNGNYSIPSGVYTASGTYNNGVYEFTGLSGGDASNNYIPFGFFAVCLTNSTGLSISFPKNGNPQPYFAAELGFCRIYSPGDFCQQANSSWCEISLSPKAPPGNQRCVAGSVYDGAFGLTYGPWIQSIGLNLRIDAGFRDTIPSSGIYASTVGSGSSPGIIFSGDRSPYFGQGSASVTNWVAGGVEYPEKYTPSQLGVVKTSYAYILSVAQQNNFTPIDINDFCNSGSGGTGNCNLSSQLNHGLYISNGNLTIVNQNYTFKNNQKYVILVNGDLALNGDIKVPNGSSVTFLASGNITVDKNVGEANERSDAPNLEGFYSADKSFIVEGKNNCGNGADRRLNIAGSVVVNAFYTGGTFQNNRNLCSSNANYPSVSFQERPDLIINAPQLIRFPSQIWREVAP